MGKGVDEVSASGGSAFGLSCVPCPVCDLSPT